jgi:hypothetical protein
MRPGLVIRRHVLRQKPLVMPLIVPIMILLLPAFSTLSVAQFSRLGLSGRTVYDLGYYAGRLYAATDTGVYVCYPAPPDTGWTLSGLAGRHILSIHPHDVGPNSWTVTAGLDLPWDDTTTSRTWCLNPGSGEWYPSDDGIDRTAINSIRALDGFPSLAICGETFAGSQGRVYRRDAYGGSWELVFDIGIGQVNAISTRGAMVMAGGETGIFAPFIARSFDKGTTWETSFPDMSGDNACDALAFDRRGVAYAGMEGAVIRSWDNGESWIPAGLEGMPYYFYGLATDIADNTVFAGGVTYAGEWGLFMLRDGELPWLRLDPPWPVRGIRSLDLDSNLDWGKHTLFIGTDGDGVLLYQTPIVSVEDGEGLPGSFECAAYPNPFNGETTISVRIPPGGNALRIAPDGGGRIGVGGAAGDATGAHTPAISDDRVTVQVYDVLGRRVDSVHDGPLGPGPHRFTWAPRGRASETFICRVSARGAVRLFKMLYVR